MLVPLFCPYWSNLLLNFWPGERTRDDWTLVGHFGLYFSEVPQVPVVSRLLCVENGPALPKGAVVTELRERTGVTARLARQRHC